MYSQTDEVTFYGEMTSALPGVADTQMRPTLTDAFVEDGDIAAIYNDEELSLEVV